MKSLFSLMLVAALALGSLNAEAAKRMGGGKSVGQQSSNVTQKNAAPAAPAQNTAAAASPAAAGAAAAPAKKPWGAMLGGLAAGLGLAMLASHLGLGEAMGQFMLFALLALVIMVVVGLVMRARKAKANGAQMDNGGGMGGLAYQGAGATSQTASMPRAYSPSNVGNDASARPWENNATQFDAANTAPAATGGSMIGAALGGSQSWGIPAGFDTAGFLAAAKGNFVTLQDAWDRSDIPALRAMMTDSMLTEIRNQLAERESHTPGAVNKTEVVAIDAQLLGIEELADHYMASVEFNGMIREDASAGPSPFREVWNMTKPRSGGGWLVAGVQALQ